MVVTVLVIREVTYHLFIEPFSSPRLVKVVRLMWLKVGVASDSHAVSFGI